MVDKRQEHASSHSQAALSDHDMQVSASGIADPTAHDSDCSDQPLLSSSPSTSSPFATETMQRPLVWPLSLFRSLTTFATRWTSPAAPLSRSSPDGVASRFVDDFEREYGADHIPFFQGGYAQALGKAKRDLRFLLVVLQSDEHDDMGAFNREVLTSSELAAFIQQHDILVWGGNVRDAEAFQVSSTLQATAYPFLAILALQTATSTNNATLSSPPKMAVADRIEGLTTTEEVIRRCEGAAARYASALQQLRAEQAQREQARRLREEQENAYRASLRADQEKAQKARQERVAIEQDRMRRARQAQEAAEQARQRVVERQEIEARRQQYIHSLYARLSRESHEQSSGETARISFRFPDGDRIIRQFRADATIRSLYEFVEIYPLLKRNESVQQVEPPTDYHHQFSFSLHAPYPHKDQKVYSPDSHQLLCEEPSLWPSALLIVDRLDAER